VLIHIADAPCHGREFNGCSDAYNSDGPKIKPLLIKLDALQLDYNFGAIKVDGKDETAQMVRVMNLQMGKEFVKTVHLSEANAGANAVGASIRSAVTKSVSLSLSNRRTAASRFMAFSTAGSTLPTPPPSRGMFSRFRAPKPTVSEVQVLPRGYLAYTLDPVKPSHDDFSKLPKLSFEVYMNTDIESVQALRADADSLLTFSIAVPEGNRRERCQIASKAFAEGGIRVAFHGLVRAQPPLCAGKRLDHTFWSRNACYIVPNEYKWRRARGIANFVPLTQPICR
jgi:hypothetical protein